MLMFGLFFVLCFVKLSIDNGFHFYWIALYDNRSPFISPLPDYVFLPAFDRFVEEGYF